MSDHRFSRRYFFYGSLLAGAVPAGGFGSTPSLRAAGFKSYNEKLNIAGVGTGIRGPAILQGAAASENIVALCDPDENALNRAAQTYPKASKHKDFRKLLDAEAKNIDAVMIATPDHLHTNVALLYMQAGKHVYCEKPLTRTAWEADLLAKAAVKYGVATQMGNQGFSDEATKTACEILWSGDIGDVKEVHAWTGMIYGGQPNIPAGGLETVPVPATLDWALWQGPSTDHGFNPMMTRQWRAFRDFGTGGSLGDWLVHNLGAAHLALRLYEVPPISVQCVKVEDTNSTIWPLRSHIVFEFPARGPMPPVTVHAYQNMRGDFKNPEGVSDRELFPRQNNLADEKNRPMTMSGDGMVIVGSQLGPDGRPVGRGGGQAGGAGRGGPGGAGRGPQQGAPGAAQAARGPQAGAPGAPNAAAGRGGMGGRGGDVDPTLRAPGNGAVFVGSKGYMSTVARGEGVQLLPAARWAEYRLPPQLLPRGVNHQQDWVRACKGGAPGVSEFAVATKYIGWLCLGAVALRVPNTKLLWDAKNLRFNNEEANKYIKPYMRKGWEVKL